MVMFYFVLPPTPGWYSYLAIKHRDGYVSVYGHLSEINVEKYEFVRRGQSIAKSGGAVGTPGVLGQWQVDLIYILSSGKIENQLIHFVISPYFE